MSTYTDRLDPSHTLSSCFRTYVPSSLSHKPNESMEKPVELFAACNVRYDLYTFEAFQEHREKVLQDACCYL